MKRAKNKPNRSFNRKFMVLVVVLLTFCLSIFYGSGVASLTKVFLISMFLSYIIVYVKHYGISTLMMYLKPHHKTILLQTTIFFFISAAMISILKNPLAGVVAGVIIYSSFMKSVGERVFGFNAGLITMVIGCCVLLLVKVGTINSFNEIELSVYTSFLLMIYLIINATGVVEAPVKKAVGEYPAEMIMIDSGSVRRFQLGLSRIRLAKILKNAKFNASEVRISPFRKLDKNDIRWLEKHGVKTIKIQRKVIPAELLLYTFILANTFLALLLLAT